MSNVITEDSLIEAITDTTVKYSTEALNYILVNVVENRGHGKVVSRGCLIKAINDTLFSEEFAEKFPVDAVKAAFTKVYNSGDFEKNGKVLSKGGKDFTEKSVIEPCVKAGLLERTAMVGNERVYTIQVKAVEALAA